jgi:endonuclease G
VRTARIAHDFKDEATVYSLWIFSMTAPGQNKLALLKNYLGSVVRRQSGFESMAGASPGRIVKEGLESLEGAEPERIVEGSPLSDQEAQIVQRAVEKVRTNQLPSHEEQFALEAIVFPDKRPVFDIINDDFAIANPMWSLFDTDQDIHSRIRDVIPSIGRIEVPDNTLVPYLGTGFVVGDGLLMTNRHVAEEFATGLGLSNLNFISKSVPAIDFKRELNDSDPDKKAFLTVQKVLMIHPYWDMALLSVSGLPKTRTPLTLSLKHPEDAAKAQQNVAVIGYPAFDPRNDAAVQNKVFDGVYYIKRLAPGKVGVPNVDPQVMSFGKFVMALTHDSSTLGGNSGSVVLDVSTGEVIALHFAGEYLKSNYGVPSSDLASDGRVIDAGVNFAKGAKAQAGPWDKYWQDREGVAQGTGAAVAAMSPSTPEASLQKPPELRISSGGESVTWTIPIEITIRIGAEPAGSSGSDGGAS